MAAESGIHEIFLKFLPHTADEAYVRKHFEGGGQSGQGDYKVSSLKEVRLAVDKATGECRGTGWLVLGEKEEAEWLVEEWNEHPYNHMEGKHVEISHARPTGNWIQRPKLDLPCRYGKSCVRADCTFKHPEGWDAEKNGKRGGQMGDAFATSRIVCRNGRHCNRPDCFFAHPDGRACDPKPAAKSRKSIDDEAAPAIPPATKSRKSMDDEEAARAIKGDFERAEKEAEAEREKKKKPSTGVVREEVIAEALQTKVVPDSNSTPKTKNKSKKVTESEVEARKENVRDSVEQPTLSKKKKKTKQSGIAGPSGESCGDESALAERREDKGAEKKRKRVASQEEAEAPVPKMKKKKKQKG